MCSPRPFVMSCCALTVLTAGIGPAWAVIPPQSIPKAQARVDVHGDLLPPGALARLGQVVRHYHGSPVHCLAVSSDGKWVATGGTDGSICLWDAATGKEIRTWTEHRGTIRVLAFAPDSKSLASAGVDQYVILWDVATGKQILRLSGFITSLALAFAPDGKTLATGGHFQTGTVRLNELTAGTCLDPPIRFYQPVQAMTFTADGQGLLTGGQDTKVRYWSKKTGKEERSYDQHQHAITAIVLAPDGKTVVTGDTGGVVHVWETATGKPIHQWATQKGAVSGLSYSVDGKFLASGSSGGVVLWTVGSWKLHKEYPLSPTSGFGFAGGHWLYAATPKGLLRRWDLTDQKLERQQPPQEDGGPVLSVVFRKEGPDLDTLAGNSWHRWDVNTMKVLAKPTPVPIQFHCVAAAPEADRMAQSIQKLDPASSLLLLVQASTAKEVRTWVTSQNGIKQLCLAADGKTLASVSSKEVVLWDCTSGQQQRKYSSGVDFESGFQAGALSRTGRWLAMARRVGAIRVWDVFTKTPPVKVGGDGAKFISLTFAPDERTLATLSPTGLIQLWDLATGGERLRLSELSRPLEPPGRMPLLFSPNGRWLAASWWDRSVRVFDLATGTEAGCFTGHKDDVTALAWRMDGLVLASGSHDATVLLWDLRPLTSKKLGPDVANRPRAWEDLGSVDAQVGHRAVWALVAQPRSTLALLEKQLRPQAKEKKSVAQLVAELDSPRFPVRDQAHRELKKRGAAAQLALQEALANPKSLEVRRRLEKLLQELAAQPHHPENLRLVRAVEVLERLGTEEARSLLGRLAKGADDGSLTIEARNALERMRRRPSLATP